MKHDPNLPILGKSLAEIAEKNGFRPFIDFTPQDYEPVDKHQLDLPRLNARIKDAWWTA